MKLLFEWDVRKACINLTKYRVNFEEAKTLFNDPFLITFPDEYHVDVEERYVSIGFSARGRILLVVHAEREEEDTLIIRIISCRQVTPTEQRIYEQDRG